MKGRKKASRSYWGLVGTMLPKSWPEIIVYLYSYDDFTARDSSALLLSIYSCMSLVLSFQERQALVWRSSRLLVLTQPTLAWDIAIAHIDPKLVKAVVGTTGLTSRLQDKDTGFDTLCNMNMSAKIGKHWLE